MKRKREKGIIIGIDLAGSEKRNTGFCIMKGMNVKTFIVHSDQEIFSILKKIKPKPKIIAIDAPLSLPFGRESLEKRGPPHLRECDKELLRRKIKFFPLTLGPMRKLTARGIKLKKKLEKKGYTVIEVYPGGAQDMLGIARKREEEKLMQGLRKIGIKGLNKKTTHDELDAVTAALVGKFYLEDNYLTFGKEEEGLIIMPPTKVHTKKVSQRKKILHQLT